MSWFVEGEASWTFPHCDAIRDDSIAAQKTDARGARRGDEVRVVRLAHQIRRHSETLTALAVGAAAAEVYVWIKIRRRRNGGSSAGCIAENREPVILKTSADVRLEANLVDVVKVRHEQASLCGIESHVSAMSADATDLQTHGRRQRSAARVDYDDVNIGERVRNGRVPRA